MKTPERLTWTAAKILALLCAVVFASGCTFAVKDPYGNETSVTIGDGDDSGSATVVPSVDHTGSEPSAETSDGMVELGGEKIKPKLANIFAAMNRALRLKRYREGRDIAQSIARAFGAALRKSGSDGSDTSRRKPPKSDTELRAGDAFNDMQSVIEDSE